MTKTASWIALTAAILILVGLGVSAQQPNDSAKKAPRLTTDDLHEKQSNLAEPAGDQTLSARPITSSEDASDVLLRSAGVMRGARSYRVHYESYANSGVGDHTTIEFECVATDRAHAVVAEGPPGRKPDTQETLFVGSSVYQKRNGGQWAKTPETDAQWLAKLQSHFLPAMVRDAMYANKAQFEKQYESGELKRIGRFVLDGTPVMLYEWKVKTGYGFTKTIRTWIGIDDNLPRKEEEATESKESGIVLPLTTRHTLTIYDYNADIRIEPPM